MKLRFASSLGVGLALVLGGVGCSGNDGQIEVDSSGAALTDKGGDSLFTIKLTDARSEGYALDGLRVKVTPSGKDGVDVTFAVDDVDANGKLDKGDTLTCTEPSSNVLGADAAGKDAEVELFATIDGKEERVGDATWTPK